MPIAPVLKMVFSPDLLDMEKGAEPDDPTDFCLLVQTLIGADDGPAADTFDFIACSPNHLEAEIPISGILPGRSYLFMRRYDYERLRETIEGWCAAAESEDWPACVLKLCRYMDWEYE